VTHRRLLVLAILVYVTLDLSLAGMPGAFVFESADSAEGTHLRSRAAADSVAPPALARGPASAPFRMSLDVKARLAPVGPADHRARLLVGRRAPTALDPAPSSEDPH
jgi:hypothetical protein